MPFFPSSSFLFYFIPNDLLFHLSEEKFIAEGSGLFSRIRKKTQAVQSIDAFRLYADVSRLFLGRDWYSLSAPKGAHNDAIISDAVIFIIKMKMAWMTSDQPCLLSLYLSLLSSRTIYFTPLCRHELAPVISQASYTYSIQEGSKEHTKHSTSCCNSKRRFPGASSSGLFVPYHFYRLSRDSISP